jgi:uncharacterized membrane protein (UPF0127 family)
MSNYLRKVIFETGSEEEPFLNLESTGFLGYTGMQHRLFLPEDDGMFFEFQKPGDWGFWMKAVRIPLDIIFVTEAKEVVYIEEEAIPESTNAIYSGFEIVYCVEANGGWCRKNGVGVGTTVRFQGFA